MVQPYRLSVKIGVNEFNGEGDEASVRADYQKFIERVVPPASPMSPKEFRSGLSALVDTVAGYRASNSSKIPAVDRDMLASLYASEKAITVPDAKKLFEIDPRNNSLSLKYYPAVEKLAAVDAVLLLLLGFKLLLSDVLVAASRLTIAAHESRFVFDRLDRVIAPHRDFFEAIGETRGTKYAMSAYGEARATWVANWILESIKK